MQPSVDAHVVFFSHAKPNRRPKKMKERSEAQHIFTELAAACLLALLAVGRVVGNALPPRRWRAVGRGAHGEEQVDTP